MDPQNLNLLIISLSVGFILDFIYFNNLCEDLFWRTSCCQRNRAPGLDHLYYNIIISSHLSQSYPLLRIADHLSPGV